MAEVANKFNLDSTYFVAFEMAHEALRRGLEQASDLNITQYRILTKLMQASAPVSQGELGKILGMKPNVVTQAVDALVAHGYATREAGTTDGRTRFLAVTDDGAEHVAAVNQSLVESLYATFPTQDPTYRTILEAAVAAAAHIEPPLHAGRSSRPRARSYPSSSSAPKPSAPCAMPRARRSTSAASSNASARRIIPNASEPWQSS